MSGFDKFLNVVGFMVVASLFLIAATYVIFAFIFGTMCMVQHITDETACAGVVYAEPGETE